MNFTFLPSLSVLIHSSSGIFAIPIRVRSAYVASIRRSVLEIADGGERWTPALLFASTQTTQLSYRSWPNSLSELCSLDQPDHCFQTYAVSIEKMNRRTERRCSGLLERNNGI